MSFSTQWFSGAEKRSVEILADDEIVAALDVSDEGRVDFRFLSGLEKDVSVPLSIIISAIAEAVDRSDVRYDENGVEHARPPK
ncbi:MAG: hypothetical protein RLN72_16650 [Henriciella sp.]